MCQSRCEAAWEPAITKSQLGGHLPIIGREETEVRAEKRALIKWGEQYSKILCEFSCPGLHFVAGSETAGLSCILKETEPESIKLCLENWDFISSSPSIIEQSFFSGMVWVTAGWNSYSLRLKAPEKHKQSALNYLRACCLKEFISPR